MTSTSTNFSGIKVLSIGASRNIGYFAAVRILAGGGTVTFLLRNPAIFDADETIQGYIKHGYARLVKGDALVKEDVVKAWAEAASGEGEQRVDALISTVGKLAFLEGFNVVIDSDLYIFRQFAQFQPNERIRTPNP